MALGKIFQMGGLYKGPNRQAEPENGWRRLLNVWQDRDSKFRPKGEQIAFYTPTSPYADTQILRTGFLRRFKDGIFHCFLGNYDFTASPYDNTSSANIFKFTNKNGVDQEIYYNTQGQLTPTNSEFTFGRDTYPNTVVGNKLFFKATPVALTKFDGVQIVRAGLPLPYVECAQYNIAGIVRWVKLVQVRLGFDGTVVASGMIKFPVNNANITLELSYLNITSELVGLNLVSPAYRDSFRQSASYQDDMAYMVRDAAIDWIYDNVAETLTATAVSHNLSIGQWVMFRYNGSAIFNTDAWMYALKVTNVVGNVITFDSNGKKYTKSNLTWDDVELTNNDVPFQMGSAYTDVGTSQYLLIYSSTTENGTFLLNQTSPMYDQEGINSVPVNINLATTTQINNFFAGQITADIQGWYDIGTVKLPFPNQIIGMTKYQGLWIAYDRKAAYFSDTSLGGSDEMISGLSNFVPLGSEYGDIVNMEGCEDFIFISRERKNFVLVGDIATGNFTIAECDEETTGAFSANSAIAIKGGVLYVSRQGIFFCNASGKISEFSQAISRLFGSSREFVTDPDNVTFQPYRMTDVMPSDFDAIPPYLGWDGNIIKMKYDPDRNSVAILFAKKKEIGAPDPEDKYAVLAINLKNGAMYEWKTNPGMDDLDVVVTDIEFFESYDAVSGKFKGSLIQGGVTVTREDNTAPRVSDILMLSSHQTAGEPSLEKQTKQLKFYGQMTGCRIIFQENWAPFTSLDDIDPKDSVMYPTPGNYSTNLFEHKQRIRTSRAQAISFGFIPTDTNFSFEGYEIEWDLIQETVKK